MLKTPAHYRPGLDFVRLAALLPVLCYHFCIEAAWSGFAVPDAFIGRAMADWVELGLAWFFQMCLRDSHYTLSAAKAQARAPFSTQKSRRTRGTAVFCFVFVLLTRR